MIGGVRIRFGQMLPGEEEIDTMADLFVPNEVFNELAYTLYERVRQALQSKTDESKP